MSKDREISRIKMADARTIRDHALLTLRMIELAEVELSEKQQAWLLRLSVLPDGSSIDGRAAEFLVDMREKSSVTSEQGGYPASKLLQSLRGCDMADDEEEWVEARASRASPVRLSRSEWARLFALCRRVDIIQDNYIPIR